MAEGFKGASVVDHEDVRLRIVEGVAQTLWALQWAAYEESQGREYPSVGLEEIVPDTPDEAYEAALEVIAEVEYSAYAQCTSQWRLTTITCLYAQSVESDDDTPRGFGAALAYVALRTGMRWGDSHERDWWFEVPAVEVDLGEAAEEAGAVEVGERTEQRLVFAGPASETWMS